MNELNGTVPTNGTIKGNLSTVFAKDGKSAYEIAVENGFDGSEKEWLEYLDVSEKENKSNKINSPNDVEDPNEQYPTFNALSEYVNGRKATELKDNFDDDHYSYPSAKAVIDYVKNKIGVKSSVTLLASAWQGSSNLYSQVVTIKGVTANSKVDLNPSVEQLQIFYNKDISFVTENDGGVITVFCLGQKPTNDYTMQVTITEVIVNG